MAENGNEEERLEDIPDPLQDLLLKDIEVSGRELGIGSYSSVLELSYKGIKCAGKKLHKNLYDQGMAMGPEILERFGVECELLSQLRHPRILQFLGLYLEDGSDVPILVLEYMPCALSDCIEQYGKLHKELSFSILHDVSLGLHYLHTHSPIIIHRDLTANNVLLTPGLTAKIADLGMAKILNITPAQMTGRMTVCPGTISYMPPEALTSDPQYDTKLDIFSFGVLATHIFCGEWPIASEYLQSDPQNPGHLYPLTEIQRREKYLRRIKKDNPLLEMIMKCLRNLPSERPDMLEVLHHTREVVSKNLTSYENGIEMLNQIKADKLEKEQLKAKIEELSRMLHEKEHETENLNLAYNIEIENLKEQVMRLEQSCTLQEVQLSQLQAENNRLQLLLTSKKDEVELLEKNKERLASELALANTKLEEMATQSLEKLKQLQAEVIEKSQEREEALKRLTANQISSALKVSLGGQNSCELSNEYEEFFLNSADDITELLKKLPRVSASNLTHLQAQQVVCSMVQFCYDQCKSKVMELAVSQLDRLFSVHSPPVPDQHTALHDLSLAYGLLIKELHSKQLCNDLCKETFPKFLEKHSFRIQSRTTEASLRQHMINACKLTLNLVTAWPPLIISTPVDFCEDWHDREFQYWEKPAHKNATPMKLFYTRPVLFGSYKGDIVAKGWVGNRDKDLGVGLGNTRNSKDRSNRKKRHVT